MSTEKESMSIVSHIISNQFMDSKTVISIPLKYGVNNPIINGRECYTRESYIEAATFLIKGWKVEIEYVDQRDMLEEYNEDKSRFKTIKQENVIGFLLKLDEENLHIIPNENFYTKVKPGTEPYLKAYMRFIKDGDKIEIITWDVFDSRIADNPRNEDGRPEVIKIPKNDE